MGGHRHPTKRCDTCEFWARGDQYSFNEKQHIDDREATCHRNAPRPSLGEFEYELLKHIVTIAAQHVIEEEQKGYFDHWEEAYLQTSSWPSTTGSAWCGEWVAKTYDDVKDE